MTIAFTFVVTIVMAELDANDRNARLTVGETLEVVRGRWRDLLKAFGIVAVADALAVATVVGAPLASYLLIRWQFFPRTIILDDASATQALKASARAVRKRWLHTALVVTCVSGVAVAVGFVVALIVLVVFSSMPLWALPIVMAAVSAAAMPLGGIALTLLYGDAVAQHRGEPAADSVDAVPASTWWSWMREVSRMVFKGWPAEAIEFYEGLEGDNTKAHWQAHKSTYDEIVKQPMEELLSELADEFGAGRVFRPYRDTRFSKDKTPYKLNCAAYMPGGYISFSADGLFVGSGLYMPEPAQLQRFRVAVDDPKSGPELELIVSALRKQGYEVGAHDVLKTSPKGYAKDHPRVELLKYKGIVMSKSWPVAAWLGTKKAKDRVVAALRAAQPLNAWIERCVG